MGWKDRCIVKNSVLSKSGSVRFIAFLAKPRSGLWFRVSGFTEVQFGFGEVPNPNQTRKGNFWSSSGSRGCEPQTRQASGYIIIPISHNDTVLYHKKRLGFFDAFGLELKNKYIVWIIVLVQVLYPHGVHLHDLGTLGQHAILEATGGGHGGDYKSVSGGAGDNGAAC